MNGPQIVRFGDFEFDAGRGLLRRIDSQEGVPLTPRLAETLSVLVSHAGELVDKNTLLSAVWPGVVVEENSLARAISALRKTLGERPGEQRYIATVPGRGYRFVAEVTGKHDATLNEPDAVAAPTNYAALGRRMTLPMRMTLVATGLAALVLIVVITSIVPDLPVTASDSSDGSALLSNHEPISSLSRDHTQPALSPDATRVAFVRDDDNGVAQIWVQGIVDGEPHQITFTPLAKSTPSWSRDNRILFTVHQENGIPTWVHWVDEFGTLEPSQLLFPAANATYSFDGETIVFERGKEIWLADANGENQRVVEGVPKRLWDWEWMYPALSPDNQTIAFYMQATGPLGDIWLIPAAGGKARPLTAERQHIGRPAWGADGRHVYFTSRSGGTWNLWRVDVESGQFEQVTSGVGEDRHPTLARDGTSLVYQNTRTTSRFMLTDPFTGESESLGVEDHLSWFANVSHDGRRIAYFAEVAPREQVFVMNIDGTGRRQLTFGDADEVNVMPRWAHDGSAIYYHENLASMSLKRIGLDGGPSDIVFPDFRWEYNQWLEWSPDGRHVAYVRSTLDDRERPPEDRGPRRIVVRDMETGEERVLREPAWSAPRWSPDGSTILAMGNNEPRRNEPSIVACDPVTEECRELFAGPTSSPQWSRDGSRIYFIHGAGHEPSTAQLWMMNADGSNAGSLGIDIGPRGQDDGPIQVVEGDRILWIEHRRSVSRLWRAELPNAGR